MLNSFLSGFLATADVLCLILGGAAAILAVAAICLTLLAVAGAGFDILTRIWAGRIRKSGRKPRNRLEEILTRNHGEV